MKSIINQIKNRQSGFTIVELLVVIVVIGILASITIVAYNGVTSRANTSKAAANAEYVQRVVEAISADGSTGYPSTISAVNSGSTNVKLPSNVLAISGACATCTSAANTKTAAGLLLPASTSTSPDPFTRVVVFGISGSLNTGGALLYRNGDGTVSEPIYYGAATSTNTFAQLP